MRRYRVVLARRHVVCAATSPAEGTRLTDQPRICIFGAGSIGCYVGGRLASGGAPVSMIGRASVAHSIARGLRITDHKGFSVRVPAGTFVFASDHAPLAACDVLLVCVKSAATATSAAEIARLLPPRVPVVSLQNGIGNADELQRHLPDNPVLPGVVHFNVVQPAAGHFHQATEGGLSLAATPDLPRLIAACKRVGLDCEQRSDISSVQWGKLLLNLNNAVNALSQRPLRDQLSQRDYRRCLALAQSEALGILARAGIRPSRMTPLPPGLVPYLLRAPDAVFRAVSRRSLEIDPHARSSMQDDLEAGRLSEVDWLNGEFVRLAESVGLTAPVNARLCELIHAAEQGGRRQWQAADLLADLTAAR